MMNLAEFRQATKDLPEETIIYFFTGGAWCSPASLNVRIEEKKFLDGYSKEEHSHLYKPEYQLEVRF